MSRKLGAYRNSYVSAMYVPEKNKQPQQKKYTSSGGHCGKNVFVVRLLI